MRSQTSHFKMDYVVVLLLLFVVVIVVWSAMSNSCFSFDEKGWIILVGGY